MKKTHLAKAILAIGLVFAIPTVADAQVKSLVKKAVGAATGKTAAKTQKTTPTTSTATTPTTTTSTTSAAAATTPTALSTMPTEEKTSYDATKTYSPSAAAKAADPMASDNTVAKHYTRTPAQIRGAYEHLDKDLFPYQPYYRYNGIGLYLDGTQQTDDFVLYMAAECKKMINESDTKLNGFENNGTVPIGDTGKSVPWTEVAINAYFAQYLADPNSYMAYRHMIKAYIIAEQQFLGCIRTTLDAGSETSVTNKSGKNTLFEPESARLKRNNKLMDVVFDVAMASNYDNVFTSTYSMLTQADKAWNNGNMEAALNNYCEFVTSYDFFLTKHEGWATDSRASQFDAMYKEARNKMQKAQTAFTEDRAEPVDMPKTYSVGADIKAMAKATVAKQDPEHKDAPIYFISNGWRTLTRNGFITHRAIDIAWEYKDAKGQRWLNHGIMMQQAEYRGMQVIYLEGRYGMSGYGRVKLK